MRAPSPVFGFVLSVLLLAREARESHPVARGSTAADGFVEILIEPAMKTRPALLIPPPHEDGPELEDI
jgi:hypothetical protein